jgi:hypothetical protein
MGRVTVKSETLRPCLVYDHTNTPSRAIFHGWTFEAEVVAPALIRGGHNGGQLSSTMALVEFETGRCGKVHPERVMFLDSAGRFKAYDWSARE